MGDLAACWLLYSKVLLWMEAAIYLIGNSISSKKVNDNDNDQLLYA
jgi:hypothetical protein